MVVTGAADRMPERLAHLVYLNALVPENRQSAFDLLPARMRELFEEGARKDGDGWRIPVPPFEDDPAVAAFVRGRNVPTPLRPFTEPIQLTGRSATLQRTFVWCTEDPEGLSGVADLMQPFAERARHDPTWHFHVLNAHPDSVFRDPDDVADLLDRAATAT
jgi:hypothetical protein